MKKYIVTGVLVWMPLAITVWVLLWVLSIFDGVFRGLMLALQAVLPDTGDAVVDRLLDIPGLGVLLLLLVMLLTGMFVTNFVGQWWLRQWDNLLSRIPIVKSIYNSVKQVSDTLFSSSGQAFREAVLVQYPRAGAWTIAFVTGKPGGEVSLHLADDFLSLYVPTTPNPTSGFFLMVPRADVVPLQMTVDDALKYVISMGVVAPPLPAPAAAALDAPPVH